MPFFIVTDTPKIVNGFALSFSETFAKRPLPPRVLFLCVTRSVRSRRAFFRSPAGLLFAPLPSRRARSPPLCSALPFPAPKPALRLRRSAAQAIPCTVGHTLFSLPRTSSLLPPAALFTRTRKNAPPFTAQICRKYKKRAPFGYPRRSRGSAICQAAPGQASLYRSQN